MNHPPTYCLGYELSVNVHPQQKSIPFHLIVFFEGRMPFYRLITPNTSTPYIVSDLLKRMLTTINSLIAPFMRTPNISSHKTSTSRY